MKTVDGYPVVYFEVGSSGSFRDIPPANHFVTAADIDGTIGPTGNAYASVSHKNSKSVVDKRIKRGPSVCACVCN